MYVCWYVYWLEGVAKLLLINKSLNKFYSLIVFNLQINAVILLLNCSDTLSLHIFSRFKCYFFYTSTKLFHLTDIDFLL